MENDRKIINSDEHLTFSKSPNWLMRRQELNPGDKLVYIRLRQCGYATGQYWASQEFLSWECGISLKTVKRSLLKLESFGLISRKRNGKKMFNTYFFHEHEWMTNDNRYHKEEKSDGSNCPITQSDRSNWPVVIGQIDPSIYIDKYDNISNHITSEVDQIFTYWKTKTNHPKSKLDAKRKRSIENALKKYSASEIKDAIDGVMLSEFHVSKGFTDIELICRNATKTDHFIQISKNPGLGKPKSKFSGYMSAMRAAMENLDD